MEMLDILKRLKRIEYNFSFHSINSSQRELYTFYFYFYEKIKKIEKWKFKENGKTFVALSVLLFQKIKNISDGFSAFWLYLQS